MHHDGRLGHTRETGPLTAADGDKPKRRGPKPDSKPPLTRKQELNRQAQRYVPARPPPAAP